MRAMPAARTEATKACRLARQTRASMSRGQSSSSAHSPRVRRAKKRRSATTAAGPSGSAVVPMARAILRARRRWCGGEGPHSGWVCSRARASRNARATAMRVCRCNAGSSARGRRAAAIWRAMSTIGSGPWSGPVRRDSAGGSVTATPGAGVSGDVETRRVSQQRRFRSGVLDTAVPCRLGDEPRMVGRWPARQAIGASASVAQRLDRMGRSNFRGTTKRRAATNRARGARRGVRGSARRCHPLTRARCRREAAPSDATSLPACNISAPVRHWPYPSTITGRGLPSPSGGPTGSIPVRWPRCVRLFAGRRSPSAGRQHRRWPVR